MSATFELKFTTDNDAFTEGNWDKECERILKEIAVNTASLGGIIHDVNGNKIGSWYADGPDEDDEYARENEAA